jgi:hypothetical protein
LIAISANALNMAVVIGPARLVLEEPATSTPSRSTASSSVGLLALDTPKVIAEARAALAGVRERTKLL